MPTTLIRGGTAVIGQTVAPQDILIDGETIAAIGQLAHVEPVPAKAENPQFPTYGCQPSLERNKKPPETWEASGGQL